MLSLFKSNKAKIDLSIEERESLENKLTDKEKIQQHGFDLVYGFRKRKGNK